jgi:transcriptional regulator with XRE-family HTH domain
MMVTEDLIALRHVRALCASGAARKVRVAADLSLGEVAEAARVSTAAVSRWELGLRRPSGAAALRYAAVLDRLLQVRP